MGLKERYCSEYLRFRGVKEKKFGILNSILYLSDYLILTLSFKL